MIKNTPNECMGSQPIWTKFGRALNILVNPVTLFLDKIGFEKKPLYQTSTGIQFYTRGQTTDINDAMVVLSGNENPKELRDLKGILSQSWLIVMVTLALTIVISSFLVGYSSLKFIIT